MKIIFSISLCLLFAGKTFSQFACSNIIVVSPVVSKPTEGGTVSATCSALLIKWRGAAGQSYVINSTFKDPVTNQSVSMDATEISCDNDNNCTATIPAVAGSRVSWSVQAVSVIDGRTFYSYPLRIGQDYLVPDCNQPMASVEEPASASQQAAVTASEHDKEKLFISNDKLAMYPNPVNNILNIKLSSEYKGQAKLSIVDISGQEVQTADLNKQQPEYTDRITVSRLKPGMYFLNIKMKNGRSITARFIKN